MSEAHPESVPPAALRATDADRDDVVAKLKAALNAGALHFDEIEARLTAVYEARTRSELDELTEDLPDTAGPQGSAGVRRRENSAVDVPGFRVHAIVYGLVIVMLVGIWAMTGAGSPFWPFFPAAGWGVGVGAHYAVATELARKKARRRERATQKTMVATAARAVGPVPARTFVAAMFADVVGSTSLNEAMGDEQWSAERARFRAAVGSCAAVEGGWEVNAAGDGVLVRFSSPAAAVRAAASLQREMAARRASGFAPEVSVGIHSGDVVDEGDDLIGSVINMAARVGDVAGPGEIVVTEHVADHVDDAAISDFGLHDLKGLSGQRHLLSVSWSEDRV